ncbi:hypothetical protein CYMTET_40599 [Cymbomonas tetramitiformis]|uniref:CENP-V/GFA domain-containing protein n=1 Tax=Cymbomonas tetramitiformis TaxID=36881 RepID=A0AAE0C7Q8_9CHLO|nr:hypothetical protein CYMTET_40599 [Cymbomonas tetramitiformis]
MFRTATPVAQLLFCTRSSHISAGSTVQHWGRTATLSGARCSRAAYLRKSTLLAVRRTCPSSYPHSTTCSALPDEDATVVHKGGCHCGAVRFEVDAPRKLVAWDCNCSICALKRNTHFVVPSTNFRYTRGEDSQSCYTFGTHTAKHLFCATCGVCSHYIPRSNPDGVAVTIHCIYPGTVEEVETRIFDGENWEDFFESSGIAEFSKDSRE